MKKLWNHICEVLLEDTVFDFQKKKDCILNITVHWGLLEFWIITNLRLHQSKIVWIYNTNVFFFLFSTHLMSQKGLGFK